MKALSFQWIERLLESAFVSLAEGYDPAVRLEMFHEGAAEFALGAHLGLAARLDLANTVYGPAFRCDSVAAQGAVERPRRRLNKVAAVCLAEATRNRPRKDEGR